MGTRRAGRGSSMPRKEERRTTLWTCPANEVMLALRDTVYREVLQDLFDIHSRVPLLLRLTRLKAEHGPICPYASTSSNSFRGMVLEDSALLPYLFGYLPDDVGSTTTLRAFFWRG